MRSGETGPCRAGESGVRCRCPVAVPGRWWQYRYRVGAGWDWGRALSLTCRRRRASPATPARHDRYLRRREGGAVGRGVASRPLSQSNPSATPHPWLIGSPEPCPRPHRAAQGAAGSGGGRVVAGGTRRAGAEGAQPGEKGDRGDRLDLRTSRAAGTTGQ